MPLTSLESQILTGAVAELRQWKAAPAPGLGDGDRHERARLRSGRQCAEDNVVRLNTHCWSTEDTKSGAGRVRVTRSLKKLEASGYIERLEMYLGAGRTSFIRITPAGLAAAEAFQPAERSA